MRAIVLGMALLAAVVALPVPAHQAVVATISAPTPKPLVVNSAAFTTLLDDPFLADRLSYAAPARLGDLGVS